MTGNETACAGPDARHVASRIPARALRRDSAVLMIRVLKSGAENTRSPRLSAIMRATFRIVLLETDYMSFSAMRGAATSPRADRALAFPKSPLRNDDVTPARELPLD